SNAFKFAPIGGSVRVTVEKIAPSARYPHGSALVTIWDNGKGIPEDKLGSIFEFYYQLHNTNEQQRGNLGSGIGLALAKNLTEMHGGEINVTSYDGQERPTYTCFTVELPLGNAHYRESDFTGVEKVEKAQIAETGTIESMTPDSMVRSDMTSDNDID